MTQRRGEITEGNAFPDYISMRVEMLPTPFKGPLDPER